MTVCSISEQHGSITITFHLDHHRLESWFEVAIALYSTDKFKGMYKTFHYATYRAAHNKLEALKEKYGFCRY